MTEKAHFQIIASMLKQEVMLVGQAVRSKAGPGILLREGNFVIIDGLDDWSDELLKKQVAVKGVLFEEKIIPDVVIAKDGAISQGAFGNQLILRSVSFVREYSSKE